MFWKCGLLLWVGVVQTSRFHIFCFFQLRKKFRFFWEIIWDASHNYLIELTISDLSWFQWLDIGVLQWTQYYKRHIIFSPITPLYVLGVENNLNWDGLHSPNVNHCLIHLLGINFKGVFGKKFWCFLHSWLWPCISHPIYLTEQNAKIEPNNWKEKKEKKEKKLNPHNKVDDQFFKTSKLHSRKKNWPLGCMLHYLVI
jgi:hypothetical protein